MHKVVLVIAQPRRDNFSTYEISIPDLYDWAENILVERAQIAWKGEGEQVPWHGVNFAKLKLNARFAIGLKRTKYDFT